jgi:MoaA/NifB/PqqE/SkfB family radical SAM enzyme
MKVNLFHKYDNFLTYLSIHPKKEVYIFGADIAGKVIMEILKKKKISIAGFLDNNKNKCNKKISDVNVYHSKRLETLERENTIILIASTYVSDIAQQIESLGFTNWMLIHDIFISNKNLYSSLLNEDLKYNYSGGRFTDDFINFTVANMIESQNKYLNSDWLYIRSVDLIVTERCSLKCKDCSNLMQYYDKAKNIHRDELLQDLEDLNKISDEINEIRVIGGEPLMNKDFHEVCKAASNYKKFNKIVVYTNGTICPTDEKLKFLKNEKIFVFITTYGALSKNANKLAQKLEEFQINFNKQPAYGWTDSGKIKNYNRSEELNKKLFKNCCAKHFITYTDGKMFRCPFSANLERLQAIPADSFSDFYDIRNNLRLKNVLSIKKDLKFFLREKENLVACNFCNGRSYGQPEIEPGIQAEKIIDYEKYAR